MDGQVIRCGNCGQANRVPDLGGGKRAVCGKCKAPLNAGGRPIVLTDSNFDDLAWYGPCRVIGPVGRYLGRGS